MLSASNLSRRVARTSRPFLPRQSIRPFTPSSSLSSQSSRVLSRNFQHPPTAPTNARAFSSSTAAATATPPAVATAKDAATTAAKPVRDFFLDNLGKVFLSAIALVIGSLVRSSYGASNKKAVTEELEASASIDPSEMDDLRQANSELTADVFRSVAVSIYEASAQQQGSMTYPEFVKAVRKSLIRLQGGGVNAVGTVGMGHLLDRVVISALQDKLKVVKKSSSDDSSRSSGSTAATETSYSSESFSSSDSFSTTTNSSNDDVSMPISFWMTVLSMALNGPVTDRIQVLYEVLELQSKQTNSNSNSQSHQQQHPMTTTQHDDDSNNDSSNNNNNSSTGDANTPKVTVEGVTLLVQHLQDTCQLSPDTQVVPTETKYPIQQYKRGSPKDLVAWDTEENVERREAKSKSEGTTNSNKDCLDVDAFAGILRSRSVCAWGECYHKRKI